MSLLTWNWLTGYHMSPRFMTFMYLKCQIDLDTCHHLIFPCVLVDMVLWTMMTWYLNVCATFITLWLQISDLQVNLHVLKPFSPKWSTLKWWAWKCLRYPSTWIHPTNVISSISTVQIHFGLWDFRLFPFPHFPILSEWDSLKSKTRVTWIHLTILL
jgi:hypothetical protein